MCTSSSHVLNNAFSVQFLATACNRLLNSCENSWGVPWMPSIRMISKSKRGDTALGMARRVDFNRTCKLCSAARIPCKLNV
jgi:hypothetical protein